MIWITTLCLLAVAAWLILNGMNERRWVQAHQHDENVAANQGLFPKYEELKRSPEPEGRYSIKQANSSVARAADGVREKTAALGNRIEEKVAAGISGKPVASSSGKLSKLGNSITGTDSLIGKTADKLSKKALEVGEKIPADKLGLKVQKKAAAPSEPAGPVGNLIKSLSDRLEKIDQKVEKF